MKLVRRLIYFVAAFVLGTGAMLAFLHQMGLFEVRRVPVELLGATAADEGQPSQDGQAPSPATGAGLKLRMEQALKRFSGRKIWEIDLGDIRASLVKDEWVSDVLISRSLPNEIRVRVRPKKAVLVMLAENGFLPVTETGELLSPLPAGVLPDVPLLRGDIFISDATKRAEAVMLVSSLSQRGPLSANNVSEIGWSGEEGYSLTLIQPKVEVKLGTERIELKAMRVAQVVNYLSANSIRGRIIDASFSKKVLVRLRNGP